MSTEEDEEKRLCQCFKKYQTIVKQIDELVEIVDVRTRPPKRTRKNTKGSNSSNDPASANQPADNGEVLVQTITRFLHELKPNPTPDPDASTSTRR
ncbi:hypothetical protein PTKIN_Ptkin06aG0038400 [Pterospermum kingtungense]